MAKSPERMQLTDFTDTKMEPDRARRLQQAEDMFVNGVIDIDEKTGEPLPPRWPSYGDVARAVCVPVHLVNETGAKYNWVRRREIRQTRLHTFQNQQMARRWAETDRQISDTSTKNLEMLNEVVSWKINQAVRAIGVARKEQEKLIAAGEVDAIVQDGIKNSEIESLARSQKAVIETQKAAMERAYGLPMSPEEIPVAPEAMPTTEEEKALEAEALERALPQASVLDVYKEIIALEQKAMDLAGASKVIEGSLDE